MATTAKLIVTFLAVACLLSHGAVADDCCSEVKDDLELQINRLRQQHQLMGETIDELQEIADSLDGKFGEIM